MGRAIVFVVAACLCGATAAITAVTVAIRQGGPIAWIVGAFETGALVLGAVAVRKRRSSTVRRVSELDAARLRFEADVRRLEQEQNELRSARADLLEEERAVRDRVQHTFVNLSMRTLTLVERQLDLIERLEHGEDDPDRLDDLFQLDHLATRMRRNSENLLVIANADEHHGNRRPSSVLDVVRAAVSEIERYERVDVGHLPGARFSGHTADDIAHLLAELLENAAAYSAPESRVRVTGRQLDNGEIVVSIDDEGIGVPEGDLAALNARLHSGDSDPEAGELSGLGVFVVGALARRHGIRVQLRSRRSGGLSAVVLFPSVLVHGPGPTPAEISHERAREREQVIPEPVRVRPERPRDADGERPAAPASVVAGTTAAGLPARSRATAPGATAGTASPGATDQAAPGEESPAPSRVGRTARGLPKRISTAAAPAAAPVPPAPPAEQDTGSISAEELRRRLSGFASGLAAGRRQALDHPAGGEAGSANDEAGPGASGTEAADGAATAPGNRGEDEPGGGRDTPAGPGAGTAGPQGRAGATAGDHAAPRDTDGTTRDDSDDSDGVTAPEDGDRPPAGEAASGRAGTAAPGGRDR